MSKRSLSAREGGGPKEEEGGIEWETNVSV